MSEVKVTIEWNGNTVGVHADPMSVHLAGEADPNKIIGAVIKAMWGLNVGEDKTECHACDLIRILPSR